MGTRADFYVGKLVRVDDENLTLSKCEWLGSVAWDGMPYGPHIPKELLQTQSEEDFRKEVEKHFESVDHATRPDQGWPWPWNNSQTTDWAYIFDPSDNVVHFVNFSDYLGDHTRCWAYEEWCDNGCEGTKPDDSPLGTVAFPDMTHIQEVDYGKRSGLTGVE